MLHCLQLWHSEGTGVTEVVASKASLVTQLFLDPEEEEEEVRKNMERHVEQADECEIWEEKMKEWGKEKRNAEG